MRHLVPAGSSHNALSRARSILKIGVKKVREKGFSKIARSATKLAYRKITTNLCETFPGFVYHVRLPLSIVYIETSSKCNLACKMCYRSNRDEFMSWDLFKKIVDELYGHHVSIGLHFAGEPLLHPQFKQFLTYVLERHSGFNNVGFVTNGTLFGRDMADLAVEYGLDWVTFSLEGYAEVNDAIRIGSRYDIVSRNIEYLLSQRKNKKPFVTINATMQMDHNSQAWNSFVQEWAHKVDRVTLNPLVDDDFHWLTFWSEVKLKKRRYCRFPLTGIDVLCNGDVVVCGCDLNAKTRCGNVKEKGIFDLWNSHEIKVFQHNLLSGEPTNYPCDYCDRWKQAVDEPPKLIDDVVVSYDFFVRNYEIAH